MRTNLFAYSIIAAALLTAKLVNGHHYRIFVERESGPTTSLIAQTASQSSQLPRLTSEASAGATTEASAAQSSGAVQPLASASESTTRRPGSSYEPKSASSTPGGATLSTSALIADPTGVNNVTLPSHDVPLPLHPEITPALAVAGAILIGTGLVYALIGIKNKWLHIYLSTAYLISLSVTVLIVYVMHPPVRNSIQGAYFVAVFFSGVILGGLSLIFQDVTEGLGCLLGGFCVSMWFLGLKSGGLVTSTSGKAIFIAAFTAATFALSFTHHTRPYGLIGSISFAGATAIVLGIDCYSRAGLKEFWLYIWALNDDLFPLNTNTYPITRGMRVEIASIIILFILAIISQIKLWKVLKNRQEQKNTLRLLHERDRDQTEETVGRRLEEGNHRERAQWEAVYGDRDQRRHNVDSGIGTEDMDSPRKGSISGVEVREIPASMDSIEMNNLARRPAAKRVSSNTVINPLVTALLVGERSTADQSRKQDQKMKPPSHPPAKRISGSSPNQATSKPESKPDSIIEMPEGDLISRAESLVKVPPPPVVSPLPFKIPTEDVSENDTDRSSIATFAASDPAPSRQLKRKSDQSIFRRLSGKRRSTKGARDVSRSEEALVIPGADRSRTTSVAATHDDEMSSRKPSLEDVTPEFEDVHEPLVSTDVSPHQTQDVTRDSSGPRVGNSAPADVLSTNSTDANDPTSTAGDIDSSDSPKPGENLTTNLLGLSLTPSTNPSRPKAQDLNEEPQGKSEAPKESSAPQSSCAKSERRRSRASSESSGRRSLGAQAVEQLPSQVSKVVISYRTNEWAKHLNGAEAPELDPLVPTNTDELEAEAAAPVSVEALKQTALNAAPPPAIEKPSQSQATGPEQVPLGRSSSNTSKVSVVEQRPRASVTGQHFPSRTASQFSLSRTTPQISTKGVRSSSTPFLSQNVTASPIEENVEASYPPRNIVSPIPTGGPTLMAQRDSRVRNRHSSTALNGGPSDSSLPFASVDPTTHHDLAQSSVESLRRSLDDDNISLSERRDRLKQRSSSAQAISSPPLQTRLSAPFAPFDSHQPKRESNAGDGLKREAMLATWRESFRRDVADHVMPQAEVEQRRADMLLERDHGRLSKQYQEAEKHYRDQAIDHAMRRRDMMEAHKEAMRRMQASANKHV